MALDVGLIPTHVFPESNLVLGDGPFPCDWMFIGEAPGEQEHSVGRPFVGPSGRLLNRLLEFYTSLRRSQVYVTNVCKHHPPGNATPKANEVKPYIPYLLNEIAQCQPKVIVTVGAVAARVLDRKIKMKDEHGVARRHVIPDVWDGVWVPWWHTSYALQFPKIFEESARDAYRLHDEVNRVQQVPLELDYGLASEDEVVRFLIKRWMDIGFDTETTSPTRGGVFMTDEAELIGYSVSWAPGQGVYVPTNEIGPGMASILESPLWHKVCHNAKFEYKILTKQGLTLTNYDDTRICSYLCGDTRTGLKTLARQYLGASPIRFEEVTKAGAIDTLTPEAVADYASMDADHTLRLWPVLHKRVEQEGLEKLYREIELPLAPVLVGMESKGMLVDEDAVRGVMGKLIAASVDAKSATLAAFDSIGAPVENINSNDHIEASLVKLGAPLRKKTESGNRYAVDDSVLNELREWGQGFGNDDPIAPLLTYKKSTTMGKFANGFNELRGPDGRLHPSFNQCGHYEEGGGDVGTGTATGRISVNGPNMQNIPHHRATLGGVDWGHELRRCIIAPDGFTLLSADLGQEEPRIVAVLANDQTLIDGFAKGLDIYRPATEALYPHTKSDEPDEVWKPKWEHWERFIGKTFFLARYYGADVKRLMTLDPNLSRADAVRGVKMFDEAHPARKAYIEAIVEQLTEYGYVESLYGRKRWISKIWHARKKEREDAIREGANMRVQSTAADILKIALLRIHTALLSMQSRLVSTIHDEVIIEAANGEVPEVLEILERAFEGLLPVVPLVLEAYVGQRWSDREKV